MNVIIEWTGNRHAYAQKKDGAVLLRIPRRLSESEKKRVIDLLLEKVGKRTTRETDRISLFQSFYEDSTLTLWDGELLHLSLSKKRTRYALTADKQGVPVHEALAQNIITKDTAKDLLYSYIARLYTATVRQVVEEYAGILGVKKRLSAVKINRAHTKWGSAHADGVVRISLKTLLLPAHLFRYVCAHEATHLRHMDHSVAFWNTLEDIYPHAKQARKEMKHYGY